jgi:hypothetical protein
MIGIVLRHLLAALITGRRQSLTSPFYLANFPLDMKVKSTIGYLKVCVNRVKAPTIASHPPDLLRDREQF